MSAPFVVFLRGEGWEARWLGVSAALSAAALGAEVLLALFGEPLRLFVAGRFDEGEPEAARAIGAAGIAAQLAEARAALPLRVVACDTALRLAGLDAARAVPPLDGVVSIPELVRAAREGSSASF
jgi:hypothetical protein